MNRKDNIERHNLTDDSKLEKENPSTKNSKQLYILSTEGGHNCFCVNGTTLRYLFEKKEEDGDEVGGNWILTTCQKAQGHLKT